MERTLPKKLTELGRIRIGDREPNARGGGTHPHKLSTFRLTSQNGSLLGFVASLYGGTVKPWEGEGAPVDEHGRATHFEVYTEANSLDVLIPTMSAVALSYEVWSASGCQRRCTGTVIQDCATNLDLIGKACICPADDLERADQAQRGAACLRILRLNVLLPDVPGLGTWRLETKGFYAAAELLGTLDLLTQAGGEHAIIESVLRLEQRTLKRAARGDQKAQTMKFVVPVLWPKWTPRQLLAGTANILLMAPPTAEEPPRLASPIGDLYGDQAAPAADPGQRHEPALLDALAAHPGETLETWYGWAEKRLHKARTAFTDDDYGMLLQTIRDTVRKARATGETSDPDWRMSVTRLAAETRALLTGKNPSQAMERKVRAACATATGVAEDPDATVAVGEACLETLRTVADEVRAHLAHGGAVV